MKHTIRHILAITLIAAASIELPALNPMETQYSMTQCEGSLTPYPERDRQAEYPDSLTPVFINHVGRHGARYPASAANCLTLKHALERADSLGTITPLGRRLMALNQSIINISTGRWGALDSVGIAEQQGIARRMFYNYTEVFSNAGVVQALSSYSPRSMMSMYAFTHQLDRLNNRLTFSTSTGRINSPLMRPFDTDKAYIEFRDNKTWAPAYYEYLDAACPVSALKRVLGNDYPHADARAERELALVEYYVLAGLPAMGVKSEMNTYFSSAEANALWSCFNLRQYLQRTATTVSTVPAEIASDLIQNLITTTEAYISGSDPATCAVLRFGHAETLMPLLSQLHIPGCYYLTNYFDTVAQHWCDFSVVPMAANIQFVLFRSRTGNYYMRVELNERPVALRPSDTATIYPWGEVRRWLEASIPFG